MKQVFLYIFLVISNITLAQNGIMLYNQAKQAFNKKQFALAAEKITQATNYFSDDYILQKAAEYNIIARRFAQAKKIASKIKNEQKYLTLAKIFIAREQYDSAYHYLALYLSQKYKEPEYKVKNDTLINKMSHTDWWHKLWAKQWYDSLYIKLDQLDVQAKYGDETDAIKQLEALQKQHPNQIRIYTLLAESYKRLGALNPAIGQLKKALTINSNNYELLTELSKLQAQKKDYHDAGQTLEKAYRLRPYEIELLPQIADLMTKSSDADKAITLLKKYLQYNDSQTVRYQLANTYYIKGDYLEAIRTVNQLMKKDKNNYKYLTLRGKSYMHTNNFHNAYYDMTMSLDLYPYQPELYRLIGQAAYFIGHKQEACLYWQRSYQMFHDKQALDMLNKICKKH